MSTNSRRWFMAGLFSVPLVVVLYTIAGAQQPVNPAIGKADITIVVPADAEVFFDGTRTTEKGVERRFVTPPLEPGRQFRYDIRARWTVNGKTVEQSRQVPLSAGAQVRIDFLDQSGGGGEDQQVVSSKAVRLKAGTSINFRKELNLPFATLGTLGSRIDTARRTPDPVALAHAANELAVAEKVSGKQASLTSSAVLQEAAELAKLRKQVAELQAVARVAEQASDQQILVTNLREQIAASRAIVDNAALTYNQNLQPTGAPRQIVINNYTTQYLTIFVNGFYKTEIGPGLTQSVTVEGRWNPVVVTAHGNEDIDTWGPRNIWGRFTSYTWNIN